ncbi:MAG: pyridoxamine 5'-phosphate oxidase [Bdellovibrionales bacterium]|nr:pyridoxamine 5'-phosphate oxidase [Bdellovibrionales bacterium]
MASLEITALDQNPVQQFAAWFDEALTCEAIRYANAVCLATVDENDRPDGRIVLLKAFDERGFCFFTNSNSVKGRALARRPHAAMTFYWDPLERQVRIQGTVEQVSAAEADEYFASRPRGSQLGAWASEQSRPLESREALEERVTEFTRQFEGRPVERPAHWNGYRLCPSKIEFWQAAQFRLHDRFEYRKDGASWAITRLYP